MTRRKPIMEVLAAVLAMTSCGESTPTAVNDYHRGVILTEESTTQSHKWVVVDQSGKVIFTAPSPDWHAAQGPGVPKWVIALDNMKTGERVYIDKFGNKLDGRVLKPTSDYTEGLMAVSMVEPAVNCGYVDHSGKLAFTVDARTCYAFSDGWAVVAKQNQGDRPIYGYIDKTGKFQIPAKYLGACSFSEGLAQVTLGSMTPFIRKDQTVAFDHVLRRSECPMFTEGIIAIDGGYRDRNGGYLVPRKKYRESEPFSEQRAWVQTADRKLLLDSQGKEVPVPEIDDARPFAKGLAAARSKRDQTWGLLGRDGRWVVEPAYAALDGPISGLWRAVPNDNKDPWPHFLDESGKRVRVPCETPFKQDFGVFVCSQMSRSEASKDPASFVKATSLLQFFARNGRVLGESYTPGLLRL